MTDSSTTTEWGQIGKVQVYECAARRVPIWPYEPNYTEEEVPSAVPDGAPGFALEFQRQRHLPEPRHILARDRAERGTGGGCVGREQVRMVEGVQALGAILHANLLVNHE